MALGFGIILYCENQVQFFGIQLLIKDVWRKAFDRNGTVRITGTELIDIIDQIAFRTV